MHKIRLRDLVRNFTPNWFTMNMGTGIFFLMIHAFPYRFGGQDQLAHVLWIIDIGFFALFSVLFIARMVWQSDTVEPLLRHPVQSMFLGAIPMGLIPIVNGGLIWGMPIDVVQTLWWIDVALAVIIGWLVPYSMFTSQSHSLEGMTAVWLLPIVASEVTASSGGFLAPHLVGSSAQLVIGVSYVLWALSVPLALGVVAVVVLRLSLHKLPPTNMAASTWLVLGPIGTGSLALLVLGDAAPTAFAHTHLASLASFARPFGEVGGYLLWGYGLWWWGMAWFFTIKYLKDEDMAFNMGWWGFTFPLGVYTAATLTIAHDTGWIPFKVFGSLLVLQLAFFWVLVTFKTLLGMWHGHLFHAPCLPENQPQEQ